MRWAELSNGLLLKEANAAFDILITTDQGLRFQQNLAGMNLAIIVLPTTDWSIVRQNQQTIMETITTTSPGSIVALSWR